METRLQGRVNYEVESNEVFVMDCLKGNATWRTWPSPSVDYLFFHEELVRGNPLKRHLVPYLQGGT